jgi:hypothetical protein
MPPDSKNSGSIYMEVNSLNSLTNPVETKPDIEPKNPKNSKDPLVEPVESLPLPVPPSEPQVEVKTDPGKPAERVKVRV